MTKEDVDKIVKYIFRDDNSQHSDITITKQDVKDYINGVLPKGKKREFIFMSGSFEGIKRI